MSVDEEGDGFDRFIDDQMKEEERNEGDEDQGRPDEDLGVKKQRSVLDGLTEHRSDRVMILLKNLANEDLVHINTSKIPAFLRIDNDIQREREKLQDFFKEYMEFDIEDLNRDVRQNLQN